MTRPRRAAGGSARRLDARRTARRAARRQRQHAAELAAARGSPTRRAHERGSGSASTRRVCAARHARSALAQLGRDLADDGRGQQAGVEGAGRADGQRADRHAGRHLHDRQQRVDAVQRLRLTGTPSTGSTVWAATIPGRWAAPPAPAMITSQARAPRPRSAYSASSAGVRWADTTRTSCAHARARPAPRRRAHGLPVRPRPHDHADQRRPSTESLSCTHGRERQRRNGAESERARTDGPTTRDHQLGRRGRRRRSRRSRAARPARGRLRPRCALHQDVHVVGLQLVQQPVVVGDGEHAEVRSRWSAASTRRAQARRASMSRPESSSSRMAICGCSTRELQRLVALLLATRQVDVERPVEEALVEADPLGLGRAALGAGRRGPTPRPRSASVSTSSRLTPGTSVGYCMTRCRPARPAATLGRASRSTPSRVTEPPSTS